MESLHQLIQSLTPAEIKGVRAELKFSGKLKEQELFEFLLKTPRLPGAESFNKELRGEIRKWNLVSDRLRERILEYMVSHDNLATIKFKSGMSEAAIRVRKLYSFCTYLVEVKNDSSLYLPIVDEIIDICRSYERYPALSEILHFKRSIIGLREGLDAFNRITEDIEYAEACRFALNKAQELYSELSIRKSFEGSLHDKDLDDFLTSGIHELKSLNTRANSQIVAHYLKYLETELADRRGDYIKAITISYEKLALLKQSDVLFHPNRVGIAYDDIAISEIMLGNYDAAQSNSREAQKCFEPGSFNYHVTKCTEFIALFLKGDYIKARESIAILSDGTPFQRANIIIYRAFIEFRLGKYKETLKLLAQPLELSSDKTGWAISVRMLIIMSLVELERFEEAAQNIDSLRKHIERYSKIEVISSRTHIITNLLRTLARYSFNFHQPQLDPYLQQLRLPANAWKPLTPELIPLEQWVEQKRSLTTSPIPNNKKY